ncbi:MAG: acyl-CoA dehydrogenase family protein [Oscillospiraceae bacterium]|nr:acyl-CoA dehydrogenase family protein [Oscillospiraceae bacterium]
MILDEESRELVQMVRDFVDKEIIPTVGDYEKNNEFPTALLDKACAMGLNALCVPVEYGGPGFSSVQIFSMAEEIARGDIGVGTTLIANALASYPVLLSGTHEQKQLWFSTMLEKKFAAFCLTEPGAGSDAGGVTTTAVADGDDYIINGTKSFISNGPIAGIYTVLASTNPKAGVMGLTAFIVERDRPGISIGKEEDKMGMRLSCTSEVIFDNVRVPKDHILGRKGRGFKIILETLDHSRAGVGAFGVGIAQRACEVATIYAKQRKQFGAPVANLQAVEQMLANMEIRTQTGRQMYLHAAELMDKGYPFTMEAAIAKTAGSDAGMANVVDGLQVMGGYGYMKDYPMEKLFRDAKILQIYEGTNQVQRGVIAGQMKKKYVEGAKASKPANPKKAEAVPAPAAPAPAPTPAPQVQAAKDGKGLNMLVCIKQVPDTNQIKIDPVRHTLIRQGVPAIVNTFDTYALETALRLKDAHGGRITVLTMGIPAAEEALRECIAAGADEALLITDRVFGGADTLATSRTLAAAVRYLEAQQGTAFDLIFCGKQAIDGDTAQVGPELSQHLDRALLTYALETEVSDGVVRIRRESDAGYDTFEAALPAVITVNKTSFDLRYPSFASKRRARDYQIARLTSAEVIVPEDKRGLNGSPTKVKKTYTPVRTKNGQRIEGVEGAQAGAMLAEALKQAKLV